MSYSHLEHDVRADVLCAKIAEDRVYASRPLPDDDFVILNRDRDGRVIGVQILNVREMTVGRWREFFKKDVPQPLFALVDEWLGERERRSRDSVDSSPPH